MYVSCICIIVSLFFHIKRIAIFIISFLTKSTYITPLSWLFLPKISKKVPQNPFEHHNMLVVFVHRSWKNNHESTVSWLAIFFLKLEKITLLSWLFCTKKSQALPKKTIKWWEYPQIDIKNNVFWYKKWPLMYGNLRFN